MATTIPVIRSFSSDSGTLGDGITNDNTLTLNGTAAANSTVKLYDGTTLLGSATANDSGAWSFTTGTLSNSTHSFTAATTGGSTGSPSSGFPDASTTGVPAGTSLTTVNGDFTSSYAGQIIDGLNVTGTIVINNPDVIVRNCQAGQIVAYADGATIEYCDVKSNGSGNSGIVLVFADNSTVRGCDLSGYENSIWLEASGCKIIDNYIHDPIPYNSATDPHIDGIQSPSTGGVANNLIQHNNIDMGSDSNSCITGGGATNITIDNNLLDGGTYTIYNGDNTGAITNNVFVSHQFGYVNGNLQTYSGNIDGLTGQPLVVSGEDLVVGTGTASASVTADSTIVTSAALVVTVDTVAPSAPTIAASTPTNTGVEVLTGTAEANSTVKLFDGATQIGTATANGSGAWSYTTAALSTGSHSFTAKAMDAAGNTGAASAAAVVAIAAPTQAPSAPTIASFSADSGKIGDGITNDNTLTLTGTAAANSTVKVFDGSKQVGTATADASGAWSLTATTLADGGHSLTATATNSGGTSSASAPLSVTVDTVAPSAPTIAASTSAASLASTHVEALTGTAEANSTIAVFDGTTKIGTATANPSGAWSYTTAALSTGSHSFTATATDAAGNTGAASTAAVVTIAAAPAAPTIASFSTDSGAVGDHITNDSTLTLAGTAAANSTVKVFDGSTEIGVATADSSGSWDYITKVLADAVHVLTATATDSGGQTSASSTALNVTIDTTAPNTPTIASFSNDSGVAGDSITNDNTVTLTGTAEANSTVKVFDGGAEITTVTANRNGAWTYTTSTLSDGNHSFTANATDVAGNTGAASAALAVKTDTIAPNAPVEKGDSIVNGDQVIVTGTAETNSIIKIYDGNNLVGNGTTGADGSWTVTTDALSIGSHVLQATATDAAGNTSALSQPLDPVIGGTAPADIKFTNLSQSWWGMTKIQGTADPSSVIKLYDGSTSLGSATAGTDGSWTFTKALSNTVHTMTAQEVDSSGQVVSTSSGAAILGSTRNDILKGTTGSDLFLGKGGQDSFVFAASFGNDVIRDFDAFGRRHDVLEFSKSDFDSFASVLSHASQVGRDVVISAGSDTLTLKNTKLGALDSHDFHFA